MKLRRSNPSETVWEDTRSLVRRAGGGDIARYDPATGPDRLCTSFELLVSGGLSESADRDVVGWYLMEKRFGERRTRKTIGEPPSDALRARIRVLTAAIRDSVLFEVGGSRAEAERQAGGFLELLAAWLLARAAVLTSLYSTSTGRLDLEKPELGESGRAEEEAVLLVRLLVGLDNPVPEDLGVPGIFEWLATTHGDAGVLYAGWRQDG
jgi:hypothetical protein